MNKPNILIFSLAYKPMIGGAEIAIQEITKRLQSDFNFDLVTHRFQKGWPEQENIDGVEVYRVGMPTLVSKYLYYKKALKKALDLNEQKKYDIVWGMMGSHGGLAAWNFKKNFPEVKYLLTEQTGDSEAFWWLRTWWWRSTFKKIYQQADGIQVISSFLEKKVRGYGYKGKIWLVPNGVSMDDGQINEQSVDLHKIGFSDLDKIVLTLSRLVKKNAVLDLVKAMKNLPKLYKLIIVGEGPGRTRIENYIKSEGLEKRVHLAGSVPYDEIKKYYEIAEVFCRPSLSEGFGNVFVEAMSHKVPVVATPVGGIVDIVKDSQTGLLCEVANPKSIADKILRLKNDNELKNKIIHNAYQMVQQKYTWQKIANDMKSIFETI